VFGLAECALTAEEAQQLADVLAKIAMLDGGKGKQLDPKTAAWANLLLVIVTLYLPRYFAWRARMKSQQPAKVHAATLLVIGEPAAAPTN
jgi:hypothetical protein